VNRIDNIIGSFNVLFIVVIVYAKVSMHKIYGSVSLPANVIKILYIAIYKLILGMYRCIGAGSIDFRIS
jgi:hypothetical protein